MLKIEKVEISGFKSFSDATEVNFPDGITAVVGPNGCGKSNIGDAINWVLGEQSARMLRGTSMQDVIFNGSEKRKPVGLAEVSLQLAGRANGNGEAGKTIKITRRLFRTGESEYLLNDQRSRLRDIQDLLREERVGAQTYATIEQGKIDQILNAKPKDRRLIIEEAAGVAGFKHKRRLAELKLEATQANLLRVNDIVQEVERQIGSLKRQAAKARRYGRLRDELRAKEGLRFAVRAQRIDDELAEVRGGENAARDAEGAAAAILAQREAGAIEARGALAEAERVHRDEAAALHQVDLEIERAEARIRAARERIEEARQTASRLEVERTALTERRATVDAEAVARAEALAAEAAAEAEASAALEERRLRLAEAGRRREEHRARVETLRAEHLASLSRLSDARNQRRLVEEAATRAGAQRARLEREREEAQAEHARVVQEAAGLGSEAVRQTRSVEEIRAEVAQIETDLTQARQDLIAEQEVLSAARDRESASAAALRTLEDVATRFAGVSDGVRLLLTSGPAAGVRIAGVVADFVEAARDVEGAAEAYLQGFLPAVVVEDEDDARRAAALLRAQGAGRTVFLSKTQPNGGVAVGTAANGHGPVPNDVLSDARVLGKLKDRLRLRAGDGFVSGRVGDALIVDSLESALALHRKWPHADYLATSGDVVYASGVVASGGKASAEQGLLAHARRIAELHAELAETAARAQASQSRLDETRGRVTSLEEGLESRRRTLESEARREAELDLLAKRSGDDRERAARRVQVIGDELLALTAETARIEQELSVSAATVEELDRVHASCASVLEGEVAGLEADEAALRVLLDEEAAARAGHAALAQRVEAARRESARLTEALAEIDLRLTKAAEEIEAARSREAEGEQTARAGDGEMAALVEDRRRRALAAVEREEGLTARREALAGMEASLKDDRAALDAAREEVQKREIARTRLEADRGYLDDLCRQELGMSAVEALSQVTPEAVASADEAALEADVTEIRAKVDAIGPVNLMAIDEFQALEERHTSLSAQKKDLDDAALSLRESIKRINRQSRERFVETFEIVREHYKEIFKVLFNGGRADLVLEENEDVLECGIEMIAQPPGKRLGHVSLLSGGEKSMAALALLFAIFRHQPSPFCLLDEVDAALDELNVGRFTRMLSEYGGTTQFILITHNKRSMEAASLLYGVTMEEAGVSKLVSLAL
jgi:chromosome segregation protein